MKVLNRFASGTNRLLAGSVLVIVFSGLLAIYLYKSAVLFPSSLNIQLERTSSKLVTLYYETGRGFRESERSIASMSGKSKAVKLPLPLKTVYRLRLDPDNGEHNFNIKKLCFESIRAEQCWSAQQLHENFEALNGVTSYALHDAVLQINTIGNDPHFSFNIDTSSAHLAAAQINRPTYVLCALLIVILLLVSAYVCYRFIWPWIIQNYKQAKLSGFYISMGPAAALIALFSILISGAWISIYKLGAQAYLPLLAFLLLLVLMKSEKGFNPTTYCQNILSTLRLRSWKERSWKQVGWKEGGWKQIIFISVLVMLPVSWLMIMTWGQDFPNLGDHEYHFWGNHIAYYALERNKEIILLTFFGFLFALLVGRVAIYVVVTACLLVLAGYWDVVSANQASDTLGIFARYPGGTRFLTYPFVYLSFLYDWESPLNVGRLVNYLSIPVWLLILRPLIIGKWPSLSLLPFILLFFYQTETVYFFTSAYLDIWCVVFIMLALEKLLVDDNQNAYLKACLLLAIACAFKEPAVFIIPWFWLAGKPWLLFKRKQGLKQVRDAIIVGVASVLPFIIYYITRKVSGISRYTYKGTDYFLTESWFTEMASRMYFHFGTTGIMLLGLLLLVWLYCLLSKQWRAYRFKLLCVLGAAISLMCLFNLDQGGVAFTGYFRFYLPVFILLLAPALLLAKDLQRTQGKQAVSLLVVCSVILLGNGPRLIEYLSSTQQHDAARNFTEHYDTPIFLPIRSLLEQAEQDQVLQQGQVEHIHVNHVTSWNQPDFAYPQLDRKYNLRMLKNIVCECSEYNKVVLAPFVYYAGLNQSIKNESIDAIDAAPQRSAKYAKRWQEVNEMKPECLAKLKNSCDYYHEQKIGNEVIGAIGVLK